MALKVWYESDIRNALRAAELANAAALKAALCPGALGPRADREDDPYVTGYQVGYRSALTTLALAFGLPVTPCVLPSVPLVHPLSWSQRTQGGPCTWAVQDQVPEDGEQPTDAGPHEAETASPTLLHAHDDRRLATDTLRGGMR
jgi:hypothetical protein